MERQTHHDEADLAPGELIGEVFEDARDLATAEIDKLKAEAKQVGETAKLAGVSLAFMITGAILLFSGFALGLAAAGLPTWVAFVLVGALITIAGIVVVKNGRAIANAF